jgi:hypothetical protein
MHHQFAKTRLNEAPAFCTAAQRNRASRMKIPAAQNKHFSGDITQTTLCVLM